MYIYMEVTPDKYSLPIVWAYSPSQLAQICGVDRNKISACISHAERRFKETGHITNAHYTRVFIDEEDDE